MAYHRNGLCILLAALWCASCATVEYKEDISDYRKRVATLESELIRNPNSAEALRDLGIVYFQVGQYQQADNFLKKAYSVDATDAKMLFYYGMTLESEKNSQAALAVYLNYTDVSSLSPYRKLMEGRYRTLTADIIRQQFQTLLANEQQLTDKKLSVGTIAVFPLTFQGSDERYVPLGKGLSELLITDLGQVKALNLIERVRVEALLEELQFGQSKSVDPSTAPRLGRLLSAGRIVTGSYSISSDKNLTMNVASWDVVKKENPGTTSETDALDNLFRLEKDLVFGVVKTLGITLTAVEREAIQRVPTQNLNAFLLYSIGLEKEDAHDFEAAGVYFNQAAALDPGFVGAKNKSAAMQAMTVAGGEPQNALTAAHNADPPMSTDAGSAGTDLQTTRLQNMGSAIGTGFYPGQDSRKPAQEAAESGSFGGQLPPPPQPPPQR